MSKAILGIVPTLMSLSLVRATLPSKKPTPTKLIKQGVGVLVSVPLLSLTAQEIATL